MEYLDQTKSILSNIPPGFSMNNVAIINKNIKCLKILLNYTSVFVAEASAITKVRSISLTTKNEILICIDSLSVLKSIINPAALRWNIIKQIRDLLIKHSSRLQLLWIPGHSKMEGNISADQSAKSESIAPY